MVGVRRGIETFGGTGPSLVKGVVITLSAIALSIKPGGSAREIEITDGVKTNGAGVSPIELHGAIVARNRRLYRGRGRLRQNLMNADDSA